jgi:hypothetical protein
LVAQQTYTLSLFTHSKLRHRARIRACRASASILK